MMSDNVQFGLFDKDAGVEASQRFLPHRFPPQVAVFLTFRPADSMPREAVSLRDAE